jgi:hypothetical protein
MISIVKYLFEDKKENSTKLNDYEKGVGGLVIGGGLIGKAYHMTEKDPSLASYFAADAGLAAAGTAAGALAAHKLYKIYKNKKK